MYLIQYIIYFMFLLLLYSFIFLNIMYVQISLILINSTTIYQIVFLDKYFQEFVQFFFDNQNILMTYVHSLEIFICCCSLFGIGYLFGIWKNIKDNSTKNISKNQRLQIVAKVAQVMLEPLSKIYENKDEYTIERDTNHNYKANIHTKNINQQQTLHQTTKQLNSKNLRQNQEQQINISLITSSASTAASLKKKNKRKKKKEKEKVQKKQEEKQVSLLASASSPKMLKQIKEQEGEDHPANNRQEKPMILITKAQKLTNNQNENSQKVKNHSSFNSSDQENQQNLNLLRQNNSSRIKIRHNKNNMDGSQLQPNQATPDQQYRRDFIEDELDLIGAYFMDELECIWPYNGRMGKYKLCLKGTTKYMTLEWEYNGSKYPSELIEVSYHCDHFNPLQIEKLEDIYAKQKHNFNFHIEQMLSGSYSYVFNLCTLIYQDLLLHITEQPNDDSSLLSNQHNQIGKNCIMSDHMYIQQKANLAHQKQMYGKLLEEIFYMQDFKEQPNESLFVNNNAFEHNKKYHSRGRYNSDFQEIEMIGEGGFGKVYKARNRVDSNTYAIKKIIINYESSSDRKMLKEVTLLSKLNHPNIVRYHQSWLEDASNLNELICDMSLNQTQEQEDLKIMYDDWKKSRRGGPQGGIYFLEQSKKPSLKPHQSKKAANSSSQSSSSSQGSSWPSEGNVDQQQNDSDCDDHGIMFAYGDDQDDGGIQFQDQEEFSQIQFKSNVSHQSKNRKVSFLKIGGNEQQNSLREYNSVSKQNAQSSTEEFPFKILYIVMEFCQGINLKEFISSKFKQDDHKIQIIRGILQGLVYIHERKIIHRDLKPANIFLTENNKVKIGDFGLATIGTFQQRVAGTSLQYNNENADRSASLAGDFQKTIGIGTAFYRAPQQIKSTKYDQKVDIYSLGIIIFQMFYEFSTYSERYKILSEIAKTFKLPKDFNLYGQITDYEISIQNCIKVDFHDRPSARKLLENFRNKYFVHLVSAIANPKYTQFYELIKRLFQISNQRRMLALKKTYFRNYEFCSLFQIYLVHRGSMFSCLPLVISNDTKQLNGIKISVDRKQKYLVLSQQGVLMEYCSNTYTPWIFYAKQTMKKKRFQLNQLGKDKQLRRFTFEKVIDCEQSQGKTSDQDTIFKEKYLTGFDICYNTADFGFVPFYTLEMLIISTSMVSTLSLTQKQPPLNLCHSKIFVILAKNYKIPFIKMYNCLLATSEEKFMSLIQGKKVQHFEKFQIEGAAARQICQLFDQTFDTFPQFIEALQIQNIKEFPEYLEIKEQFQSLNILNEYFNLQNIQYKLQIPSNNTNGIFWNIGPVKGFSALEQYAAGQQICNINIEMTLSQGDSMSDVSIWSNQEFMEGQIMQLVNKCWMVGVSAKYYQEAYGEKDQTSLMNMIIKKKKGERVNYIIRKNQTLFKNNNVSNEKGKRITSSNRSQQNFKDSSSVVVKENFNYDVFKQIHSQQPIHFGGTGWGSVPMGSLAGLSQKKKSSNDQK